MVLRLPDSWSNWNLEIRSKEEKQQQTQHSYCVNAGIWTRATLVGGERSHHCRILAPPTNDRYNEKVLRKETARIRLKEKVPMIFQAAWRLDLSIPSCWVYVCDVRKTLYMVLTLVKAKEREKLIQGLIKLSPFPQSEFCTIVSVINWL